MMNLAFRKRIRRARCGLFGLAAASLLAQPAIARPNDKVTYLLPAPKEAIVLAPFLLAEREGRYRREKLDVQFVVVSGGFNVGAALARGEGDLGGASGDTPILLRAANLPVKGIAQLGRHAFLTLITRQDSPASSGDLQGRRIDVPSLKDTSYYAVEELAARASHLSPAVETHARPPAELIAALGARDIDGFVGTVDWGVKAERSGVKLTYRKVDEFYPAMAQAILASEDSIARRPAVLRRFVKATQRALASIARDPEQAARSYEAAVPDSGFTHAEIVRVFGLLTTNVYGEGRPTGRFDDATVEAAEAKLLKRGLVGQRRPRSDYFTNMLVGR